MNCLRDKGGGTRVLGGTHENTFSDQVFRGRVNQDAEGVVEAAQKEVTKRKTSDFTIRIDKENRVIHVLDNLGEYFIFIYFPLFLTGFRPHVLV